MTARNARHIPWLLLLVFGVVTLIAPAAGAQADDPYGSTSTTAPVGSDVSCNVEPSEGAPGATVTATVDGVAFGSRVQINFDGEVVASAAAPSAVQSATTSVQTSFSVPTRTPGSYLVTAVGPDFTVPCGPDVDGGFAVLAAADATTTGDSGALAFTGFNLLLVVLVGLVAVAVGVLIVSRSRRRSQLA